MTEAAVATPTNGETSEIRSRVHVPLVRSRTAVFGNIAFAVLLIGAPQLVGGAFGWTIGPIAVAAVAALAVALWTWPAARFPLAPAGVATALAVLWSAIQIIPLPIAVVARLAPASARVRSAAFTALGERASTAAISEDVASTRAALVVGLAVLCAYLAGVLAANAGRRKLVLRWVAGGVGAMAVVGVLHLLVAADTLFGIYTPRETDPILVAPLLNDNHLGGFLAMGVPLLIGAALQAEKRESKIGWAVLAFLATGACVLTASRSAAGSLFVGVVVLGVLALVRRGRLGRAFVLLPIGAAVAASGAWIGGAVLRERFATESTAKLGLIGNALRFALEAPLVGVGRGAFAAAYVHGPHGGSIVRYTVPENLVAQWVSEWGAPVALTLLASCAVAWFVRAREVRSWLSLGALAAVASVVAHDLFDFVLEMPGVIVVVAALFGAAVTQRRPRRVVAAAPIGGGVIALSLAAIGLLAPAIELERVSSLRRSLEGELRAGNPAFREHARAAVRLHPGEPTFPLLLATWAVRHRDADAATWINRSLELAPSWYYPHLVAAEWLLGRGATAQALLELREAEAREVGSAATAVCVVAEHYADAETIIRYAPIGSSRDAFLDRVASCPRVSPALVLAIDDVLLSGELIAPKLRAAARARTAGDLGLARSLAMSATRSDPRNVDAWVALVDLDLEAHQLDDAKAHTEHALRSNPDDRVLLAALARVHAARRSPPEMRAAIERLRSRAQGSPAPLAEAAALLGELELVLGNGHLAVVALSDAARIEPAREDRALRAALVAEQVGELRAAEQLFLRLCRDHDTEHPACAGLGRVRVHAVEPFPGPVQPR